MVDEPSRGPLRVPQSPRSPRASAGQKPGHRWTSARRSAAGCRRLTSVRHSSDGASERMAEADGRNGAPLARPVSVSAGSYGDTREGGRGRERERGEERRGEEWKIRERKVSDIEGLQVIRLQLLYVTGDGTTSLESGSHRGHIGSHRSHQSHRSHRLPSPANVARCRRLCSGRRLPHRAQTQPLTVPGRPTPHARLSTDTGAVSAPLENDWKNRAECRAAQKQHIAVT